MNHKHILAKAVGLANPPRDPAVVIDWLNSLVEKIGMVVLMPAQAMYCNDPGNEGVTGFVVITTSHCSIHVWSEVAEPFAQMDLYSCKDFDPMLVLACLNAFEPQSIEAILVDRNREMSAPTRMRIVPGEKKNQD